MIVYNVTLKVDPDTAAEWVKWMQDVHINDVLATGCFKYANLFRLLDQDETEGITYVAQYFADDLSQYQRYIDNHAMDMRERGLKLFAGKFAAFRTIMEKI